MVEQVVTQHRFNAEIENIGKPFNGGSGWDILVDWKLPSSGYNQHITGQNWDDIAGFQVGETRDWVINRGPIKSNKDAAYAKDYDYFWNWDKTGNSTPPVAVAPEPDESFTGKPDTPSGSTRSNAPAEDTDTKIRKGACFNKAVDLYNAERDISVPIDYTRIAEITHGLYHNVSQIPMQPVGYCWVHGTGRNASTKGMYHKIEGEELLCMESGIVDVEAEPVAEEPAAPPAAPPAPAPEHHCEVHGVGYNKYSTGYMHKMAEMEAWCHEGIDGLYDEQGNPVTEALI